MLKWAIVILFPIAIFSGEKKVAETPKVPTCIPNPAIAGTYQNGDWTYTLEIRAKGKRSEKRIGRLYYKGQEKIGNARDTLSTPLGNLEYVRENYSSGWLTELTYGRKLFTAPLFKDSTPCDTVIPKVD